MLGSRPEREKAKGCPGCESNAGWCAHVSSSSVDAKWDILDPHKMNAFSFLIEVLVLFDMLAPLLLFFPSA